VVEVGITHTDIDKTQLYAAMDVPEFWRFNGYQWRIYQLQGNTYIEVSHSPTFDWVEKTDLFIVSWTRPVRMKLLQRRLFGLLFAKNCVLNRLCGCPIDLPDFFPNFF
jgi:hypothetical protein